MNSAHTPLLSHISPSLSSRLSSTCPDALLAFSVVALIVFVPKQRDPVRQRAGVYVWSAIYLGTLSLLFALFRQKNGSYPFRLLL